MKVTYHSKLYRDFRAIEPGEWRTIIRFYEEFEKNIVDLDFEEYFELLNAYTNALFEVGSYQKHLLMADVVIEASVMNNVKFFHGDDVFHKTLFKKAASCYHLRQSEKADYILRELLRIDPYDVDAAMFLKKCLRKTSPAYLRHAKAVAIFLFLMSALVVSLELIVVRSFYPMYLALVESTRNTLFLLACGCLVGSDLFHRWRSIREVDLFVRKIKRKKKR
jgi:hypothetical protein